MTVSEREIEWIVLEVIRRLGLSNMADNGVAVGELSSTAADLVLTDKVLTLSSLDGRLAGVQRVLVHPSAVITPAVRDELKDRGITVVRQGAT